MKMTAVVVSDLQCPGWGGKCIEVAKVWQHYAYLSGKGRVVALPEDGFIPSEVTKWITVVCVLRGCVSVRFHFVQFLGFCALLLWICF